MAAVETPFLPDLPPSDGTASSESIEERCFSAALICLEGHFTGSPPIGSKTASKVSSMIGKTLEKTHTFKHVREALARNVSNWIRLTRIFGAAIPSLTTRSVGPLSNLNDPDHGITAQESTGLILKNYGCLRDDLLILNKLMHIARNLLVTSEPEIPQDICAAVHFDQMVCQTIIVCVNVTSKGSEPEILDDNSRTKLSDITDLYKKLLVTSLQQAHNWTAKNDRNKMTFWYDVLFDDDARLADGQDESVDGTGFRASVARQEIQHWLERNSRLCNGARKLLIEYQKSHSDRPPDMLAPAAALAWNWFPEGEVDTRADNMTDADKFKPKWDPEITDKFEQDRLYGRVSHEIDAWWLRSRDANYDDWTIPMPGVEMAAERTEQCKANLLNRYARSADSLDDEDDDIGRRSIKSLDDDEDEEAEVVEASDSENEAHAGSADEAYEEDDGYDEMLDEEDDIDDDESYGEGPLTGLLTEIPNILDPKQIEALHMIVKSCILDSAGSGLTRAGENLQKTRCRMFLALECGKSLFREMLVFIAVWEKDEQSLIFQLTSQIVEAMHHSTVISYAWSSLRIPKDIISPAQTVLLRLVNHMFRSRITTPLEDQRDVARDLKLVMFFFGFFRTRIVPECVALMHLQAQIRDDNIDPSEFPIDAWDMDRAKEGLAQYLDLLTTISEIPSSRAKLIEWEAVFDLISLLNGLEVGVPKKPLVDSVHNRNNAHVAPGSDGHPSSASFTHTSGATTPIVERPYSTASDASLPPTPPPPPPLSEPAHTYPWSGIKAQIFTILATLLQPPPGQSSPGNPDVQLQVVRFNGIVPLLNCCAYDDHNPFAKERVTICLKWLLDGCDAANAFFRDLVSKAPAPPQMNEYQGGKMGTVRVDGVGEPVQVKVQPRPEGQQPQQQQQQGQAQAQASGSGGEQQGRSNGERVRAEIEEQLEERRPDDPYGMAEAIRKMRLAHEDKQEHGFDENDFM